MPRAKKPTIKKGSYTVIRDGYYPNGKPVDVGAKVTLTKTQATKLLHRGIIEEQGK